MKTAVEWLQQEVILQTNLPLNLENVLVFNKLIEQAKEMDKDQKGYSEKDIRNAIEMAQDWKSIVRSRGNERIEFKYTHQEIINKIRNL